MSEKDPFGHTDHTTVPRGNGMRYCYDCDVRYIPEEEER